MPETQTQVKERTGRHGFLGRAGDRDLISYALENFSQELTLPTHSNQCVRKATHDGIGDGG